MSTAAAIAEKLRHAFDPAHLEILNESGRHAVPPGSESHFRLRIVADAFAGRRLLERHRLVNQVLAAELAGAVHALALETFTPDEWSARGGAGAESPPCMGGDGSA